MTSPVLSRRQIFARTLALGITLEFAGAQAFADPLAAKRKLVVIICRGGQDGLSVSPPVGDPAYAALRGPIAIPGFGQADGALKLDETFGLHPALKATHALAMKGEARIAPAIATPDRERSHFEAQDVLENGGTVAYGAASGWLNRALTAMNTRPGGPRSGVKAISVAATAPLILRGPAETASWSPGGGAQPDHRLPGILQDLYANDPVLGPALATGLATQSLAKTASATVNDEMAAMAPESPMTGEGSAYRPGAPTRQGVADARKLGLTLAAFMTAPDGKQVAAVSVDNFDTHANQGASQGQLATRLAYLDAFIDGLQTGLGPAWADTVVVTATEFGRTARVNGTRGTDHGTASTAIVLGGGLRAGGLIGDWPTLASNRLFENRDTAPTMDMRALFKGVLRDHLGVERAALDTLVFPDSARIAPADNLTV
jgi:uncharacterized protein (DUF1501 family)